MPSFPAPSERVRKLGEAEKRMGEERGQTGREKSCGSLTAAAPLRSLSCPVCPSPSPPPPRRAGAIRGVVAPPSGGAGQERPDPTARVPRSTPPTHTHPHPAGATAGLPGLAACDVRGKGGEQGWGEGQSLGEEFRTPVSELSLRCPGHTGPPTPALCTDVSCGASSRLGGSA